MAVSPSAKFHDDHFRGAVTFPFIATLHWSTATRSTEYSVWRRMIHGHSQEYNDVLERRGVFFLAIRVFIQNLVLIKNHQNKETKLRASNAESVSLPWLTSAWKGIPVITLAYIGV